MYVLSSFPSPTEFKVLKANIFTPQKTMADDFIDIFGILRSLSQASKYNVKENLIKANEKLKQFKKLNNAAIEHIQNRDQIVKKNDRINKTVSKTSKCKVGRSVSFPVGKKYKGRKKSLLNNREFSKSGKTLILEETPKVPDKMRTRSFSRNVLQAYGVPSELEMLNMQNTLTSKCNNLLLSPELVEMTSKASKRKSCEELLETGGVKSKKLAKRSLLSSMLFHASDSFENSSEKTVCEKNSYIINETPMSGPRAEVLLDTCGVKAKTFLERLSLNCSEVPYSNKLSSTSLENQEACFNSYLVSAEPVPRLEATFNIICQKSDETGNASGEDACWKSQGNRTSGSLGSERNLIQDTTPFRPRTLSDLNKASSEPERLSPSTSDTRIIKKKNLTSYLNAKTAEHAILSKPEIPVQEVAGMQLRRLRSRPLIASEIKPIAKKRTRTRGNVEEIESKLKCREESIKQKKLDLQLKAEERKQRREERMRKTKEAREKLEKERLEKVHNSGGRKRQRVDSNKETEVKKKIRTRQAAKQSIEKKVVTKVKASKKKRSSSAAVTRKQKLKQNLAPLNETETDDTSSASQKDSPKKVKPKNAKQALKSEAVNSTLILKNLAVDEVNSNKAKENTSPKPIRSDNAQSLQASSTFVCSTTFVTETSPLAHKELSAANKEKHAAANKEKHTAANKEKHAAANYGTPVAAIKSILAANKENPVTSFKKPAVTPLPVSKKSLKSIPECSARQSSSANYDMTPYRDEDEDSNDEEDLRKPIPSWASSFRLKEAIIKQSYDPPNVDRLFGPLKRNINLTDIFGRNNRKYRKRTSSAVWQNISFNFDDSLSQKNKSSIMLT